MVKDKNSVIEDFENLVNMSSSELDSWLKSEESISSGWKNNPDDSETIGHGSGKKIVEMLKKKEKGESYSTEDIDHMRKVVSYNKRHLAQESSQKKNPESRSHRSLKNWGHDPSKD